MIEMIKGILGTIFEEVSVEEWSDGMLLLLQV